MSLTLEDIKLLSAPFPDNVIGVKVNNFNSKEKTKAMLILYLQHTDVYDRIETVDPSWSCSASAPLFVGKTIAIPMKLTIKGVTRENIGEGEDYKSAYSDAIKRVAMLFGIGRYLYDAPQAWVPYNDSLKYKSWTIQDYRSALPSQKQPKPLSNSEVKTMVAAVKATKAVPGAGEFIIKFGSPEVNGKKIKDLAELKLKEMLHWSMTTKVYPTFQVAASEYIKFLDLEKKLQKQKTESYGEAPGFEDFDGISSNEN